MKKGQFVSTSELIMMIPRLFIVTLVVVVVIIFVAINSGVDIKSINTEGRLLEYRLLNSEQCFSYEEEGKYYPGIVDLDKFKQSTVENCANYKGNKGYVLSLKTFEGEVLSEDIVFNEEFANYVVLCDQFKDRNFDCYLNEEYVLVEKDGEFIPGLIGISVVTQHV